MRNQLFLDRLRSVMSRAEGGDQHLAIPGSLKLTSTWKLGAILARPGVQLQACTHGPHFWMTLKYAANAFSCRCRTRWR